MYHTTKDDCTTAAASQTTTTPFDLNHQPILTWGDLIAQNSFSDETYREVSKISQRIFISNIDSAENIELLEEHRITHILSLAIDPGFIKYPTKFKYLQTTQINDHPTSAQQLKSFLLEAHQFIHTALLQAPHHRVLVHCIAGVSRSATVVAAYFCLLSKIPPLIIIDKMKTRRAVINPNSGFRDMLQEYFKSEDLERHRKILGVENCATLTELFN